jgi:hypothetical protein
MVAEFFQHKTCINENDFPNIRAINVRVEQRKCIMGSIMIANITSRFNV